jgi:MerR family transcriptional regulator, redox-sensitive transcriptional activator SoxR
MPESRPPFSVGELARRSGVTTSAIRFYEKRGLISADRTAGNQRLFPRQMLRIVSVIRAAQAVGLSLDTIGTMLEQLPDDRVQTHDDWQQISAQWRADLDGRIASLQQLRENLDGCIGCGCLSLEKCPLFNPDDAAAVLGNGPRYLMGQTSTQAIEAAGDG